MKTATLKAPPKKKLAPKASNGAKNGSRTPDELVQVVRKGLPFDELETLRRELALSLDQVGEKLGIPRATLHRRKATGRLAPDESDRVLRFARLVRQATEVFGTADRARQWLAFPQYGLGGVVPLDYARTEVGAREVETLLGRIDYGVYG
jgi:putative toxin-antitoxin system antitoxin component (TIGR02293 family)